MRTSASLEKDSVHSVYFLAPTKVEPDLGFPFRSICKGNMFEYPNQYFFRVILRQMVDLFLLIEYINFRGGGRRRPRSLNSFYWKTVAKHGCSITCYQCNQSKLFAFHYVLHDNHHQSFAWSKQAAHSTPVQFSHHRLQSNKPTDPQGDKFPMSRK